ncbi:MAG: GGDEF domain-containing protein [Parcubacteria group bacterium]|jgi:diguanylate cyclase (GGDEF)-like protein
MEIAKIAKGIAGEGDVEKKLRTEALGTMRAEREHKEAQAESKESTLPDSDLIFMEALVSQDVRIEELEKDQLTDTFSRSVFIPRMQNILMRLSHIEKRGDRRQKKEGPINVTFVFCDLDYFKTVNDEHGGHAFGDQILREVADIIRQNIRETDIVCRWGGDEFVIVLPGLIKENASAVSEKIREAVEKAMIKKYGERITSLSMGYFVYQVGPEIDEDNVGKEFEEAVAQADAANYEAKKRGKNMVICANELPEETIKENLQKKKGGEAK